MEGLRDHPEVESALRTGYPSWKQPETVYCNECCREIAPGEATYEDEHNTALCLDCLKMLHRRDD